MNSKLIKTFCFFLLFVAVFGTLIALANRYLRLNGTASNYTTAILVAVMVWVYYKSWRWLCHKLDIFTKKK